MAAVGRVGLDRSAEYQCHGTENGFGSDGTGNSWTGSCVREKGGQQGCGAVGNGGIEIDGNETGIELEIETETGIETETETGFEFVGGVGGAVGADVVVLVGLWHPEGQQNGAGTGQWLGVPNSWHRTERLGSKWRNPG